MKAFHEVDDTVQTIILVSVHGEIPSGQMLSSKVPILAAQTQCANKVLPTSSSA